MNIQKYRRTVGAPSSYVCHIFVKMDGHFSGFYTNSIGNIKYRFQLSE